MDSTGSLSIKTVLASALFATLVYGVITFVNNRRLFKDLPSPPHSFFWGHLKLLGEVFAEFPDNVHVQVPVTTIAQRYKMPGLFYLDLWPMAPRMLIITDPDLANKYTVTSSLPKHVIENMYIKNVVGNNSMVASDGPVWKRSHTLVASAFGASQVKSTIAGIAAEVMTFRKILLDKAQDKQPFKLEQTLNHLTFDTIGRATFGFPLGAQTKGNVVLHCFDTILPLWHVEWTTFNPIAKFRNSRKRQVATKKMNEELKRMIQERFDVIQRENVDLSNKRGLTLLDLILRDKVEERKSSGKGSNTALDDEFMEFACTGVKTLLLAGTGTTTDTASMTYMLLSAHPEAVEKLRAEHDRVFGPTTESAYSMLLENPSKVNELEYTTNVIKESLRFFPIGNSARGAPTNSAFLTYNGVHYPTTKDLMICPMQHTMHFDPELFPNPTKFDPDRFARDESPRHAWRPFERGPRGCLGQNMAIDELRIMLLLTVRDFDFQCYGLKPYDKPRATWWDMDLIFGERAYQQFIFEAKPRHGMMMTVKKSQYVSS